MNEENDKLWLAIHIADPTEHIHIDSCLWKNIEQNVVTRYPSNKKPIHMMPNEIMEKASLMVNQYGDIKLAITILTEIDKETYKPIGKVKLLFTKIKVSKNNALSYIKAGKEIDSNRCWKLKHWLSINMEANRDPHFLAVGTDSFHDHPKEE